MAKPPIPTELQKVLGQYAIGPQYNQPQEEPTIQIPTEPQVGPTIANDPRAVPMIGGFEVQGEGAERFPVGVPDDQIVSQSTTNATQAPAPVATAQAAPETAEIEPSIGDRIGNLSASKVFDYFLGSPTQEQAQRTLETQPTDPAQRARLLRTAGGEDVKSDLQEAGTYFFGRPENAGDPNIMGFGETPAVEMATPASAAGLSVNGADVLTPETITQGGQSNAIGGQTIRQTGGQTGGDFGLAGFTPQFEGQTPSQYMRGEDTPEATTFQGTDFQGRLRQFESPEARQANIEAGQASFEQASADREQRAAQQFGQARGPDSTDRGRRMATGEGTSTADLADMAKANARGASPSDIARGQKVANSLGVDLKTGKPKGGMTFEQKLASDKFDFDVKKFNYEETKEREDEAKADIKSRDAAKFAVRDTLRQNENVMEKAARAGEGIGFTTSGATGALLGLIPGTGAYDQKATVETLQADAAFSTLQQMRNASKTGGALGQVSERELDLLMGAVGNLKIGQSPEQFGKNLKQYIDMRNESMLNIYDAFAADYGAEDANEAFKISSRDDLSSGAAQGGSAASGQQVETSSGRYTINQI